MPSSFPRTHRLTTKADFTAVFDKGLKLSQGWFLALYKENQKTYPRLGLVVSKRILKNATSRNRLKRLLREGFRLRQKALPGWDLVIMARQGCKLSDRNKLQKELEGLWQRLIACSKKHSSA